jgi:hypothetical protein
MRTTLMAVALLLTAGCSTPRTVSTNPPLPAGIYPTNIVTAGAVAVGRTQSFVLVAPTNQLQNPVYATWQRQPGGDFTASFPQWAAGDYWVEQCSTDLVNWTDISLTNYGIPSPLTNDVFSSNAPVMFFRLMGSTNP